MIRPSESCHWPKAQNAPGSGGRIPGLSSPIAIGPPLTLPNSLCTSHVDAIPVMGTDEGTKIRTNTDSLEPVETQKYVFVRIESFPGIQYSRFVGWACARCGRRVPHLSRPRQPRRAQTLWRRAISAAVGQFRDSSGLACPVTPVDGSPQTRRPWWRVESISRQVEKERFPCPSRGCLGRGRR